MFKLKILVFIVFCSTFSGCVIDKSLSEVEKIVNDWTGREIIYPQNISCKSIDKDISCVSPSSTPYKILVYVDSIGCTSCKLHLYKWNSIIEEVNNEMSDLINFQFYFHPKNIEEIFFLFRKDSFKYPIYIDKDNQIDRLNNFPKDSRYQTFLLDNQNKVIGVGNPADNPLIWNLYKQIIKGEKLFRQSDSFHLHSMTSIAVDKTILELKDLEINKTTTVKFSIKNTGNNSLVLTNVATTCGCIVPEWPKQPISPNKVTEILVQVTPVKQGYFKKTITVYCNIKKRYVTLVIKGNVGE